MSGFSIEFRFRGDDATIEAANRMRDGLAPFGSDRRSARIDGPFAMAWVQSVGFSRRDRYENQPVSAHERWSLLFLGRLSHRTELASKLDLADASLEKTSDCELAMMAWCRWGEDCRAHLYGSYSFVVCDNREQRVIAIRSAEKSQHLYWHKDRDRIILSTATQAIFAFPEIVRKVDDLKVADALVLNHQDFKRSFFAGVSVIGQSETFTVDRDGSTSTRFHDIFQHVAPIVYERDEEYVEHARELVDRALDTVFDAPGKPAVGLSAGLDSTTLAVCMIERLRARQGDRRAKLKSYTSVPGKEWDGRVRPGWIGDESGPVKAFAGMYPELDAEFVSNSVIPADTYIDRYQSLAEMPVRGVNNITSGMAIRERCVRNGNKILVSGSAGNGTISFAAAHIMFAKWLRSARWFKFAREARLYTKRRPNAHFATVLRHALLTNLPDRLYDKYLVAAGRDGTTGFEFFSAIRSDYASDIGLADRMRELEWDDRYRLLPDRRAMMRLMMQSGARNHGGGMFEAGRIVTGVETISVLEDRKLMQFCYAIPDDQFYRNGVDRRLIKMMMRGKVPTEITNAPRGEQGADWHSRRTREIERLGEEIDRLKGIPSIADRIDLERMRQVIAKWPTETPIDKSDYAEYAFARYGLARGLAVARFINQVEGRN